MQLVNNKEYNWWLEQGIQYTIFNGSAWAVELTECIDRPVDDIETYSNCQLKPLYDT